MALKMAHIFRPAAAIVFNPTTQNWPIRSRIFNPSFKITNLNELYTAHPVDFPVILNVGRSERDHADKWKCDDIEHSRIISQMDNVCYIQHPYDTHVLTSAMAKRNLFYSFVAAYTNLYS